MHLFSLQTPTLEFLVSYIDFPMIVEDRKRSKEVFDSARNSAVARESGKLLSDKDVSLGVHPGREFVVEAAGGDFRDRVYLVGKRFYMISVFRPSRNSAKEELKRLREQSERKFFDSFRVSVDASAEKSN